MERMNHGLSESSDEVAEMPAEAQTSAKVHTLDPAHRPHRHGANRTAPPEAHAANSETGDPAAPAELTDAPTSRRDRKLSLLVVAIAAVAGSGYLLVPRIETMLNTVSTDDAYVNGHVTFVAPRVAGQVRRVLVEDNMRVRKGDLLVQLDNTPYLVQVQIKKAAVAAAESDLAGSKAQTRALIALGRSQRWQLQSAMEQVAN